MNQSWWTALSFVAMSSLLFNVLRYVVFAGGAHKLFHTRPPKWSKGRKISRRPLQKKQARRDFKYSLISIGVFGLVGLVVLLFHQLGWTQIYMEVDAMGWTWFLLSIPLMLIIHDAYFYWTHRLMHHRKLFSAVHKTHHLSRDPTPLTSYAFHPWEAIVEAGIVPLLALTLPVHRWALVAFATLQFIYNVIGHLGYEFYPRWFIRSPLAKIFNTTTHHHQHHQKVKCNYSLYFNWWDRLMKTNHKDYEKQFLENTKKSLFKKTPPDALSGLEKDIEVNEIPALPAEEVRVYLDLKATAPELNQRNYP